MLDYAIIFLLLAVGAALFGFGGLGGAAAYVAQFLSVLFAIVFLASLFHDMLGGQKRNPSA